MNMNMQFKGFPMWAWEAYDAKVEEHFHAGTPWNLAAAEIASWLAEHGKRVKL